MFAEPLQGFAGRDEGGFAIVNHAPDVAEHRIVMVGDLAEAGKTGAARASGGGIYAKMKGGAA